MNFKSFFFITIFLSIAGFAQEQAPKPNYNNGQKHALSVGGIIFDTWGFGYRHHFASSNFGLSANLGGWVSNSWRGRVGLDLAGLYTLSHHSFENSGLSQSSIRIYLAAHLSGVYFVERDFVNPEGKITVSSTRHNFETGIGAGPGAEFFFTPNFSLHLEVPWITRFSIEKDNGFTFTNSYPHVGGGLSYYF